MHCAIPDISLNETDISYRLSGGLKLQYPVAVAAATERSAISLSGRLKGVPVVFRKHVFINGRKKADLGPRRLVQVRNGVEIAKALRLDGGALPCISESDAGMIDIYIKQLRVAMLLTNSIDLKRLGKAPIYRMRLQHA